ncbi:DNA-directed RNA polymerase III subunit C31 [Saxophila tyrrhenica]|uniref:DNA-directed RNA polymerase III subunit C31 n=1 Tax=Saxophila tyrrhenica TaxID=1690608 RepID=A0AAV9P915_9PEZI|nr:DNA-directed RNA polymerase III subunit C31 [Saxophila tyrrhenica]
MSRGGRGGARGGSISNMKTNEIPFEIDPELSETADRCNDDDGEARKKDKDSARKIFPNFGEMIFPAPITRFERAIVQLDRATTARRRAGPFWTGNKDQWAQYEAKTDGPVRGHYNAFEDAATYSRRLMKKRWRPADLTEIKLDKRFFPKELQGLVDKDYERNAKRQKTGPAKKSVTDMLSRLDENGDEDEEPESDAEADADDANKSQKGSDDEEDFDKEPGDTNFESDEEEMGGDYNAERYFDGGDEDDDEGGGGGGGGGEGEDFGGEF